MVVISPLELSNPEIMDLLFESKYKKSGLKFF